MVSMSLVIFLYTFQNRTCSKGGFIENLLGFLGPCNSIPKMGRGGDQDTNFLWPNQKLCKSYKKSLEVICETLAGFMAVFKGDFTNTTLCQTWLPIPGVLMRS